MTTDYHTPIAADVPFNAQVLNAPLGQLDDAITTFKVVGMPFTQIRLQAGADIVVTPSAAAASQTIAVTKSLHKVTLTEVDCSEFNFTQTYLFRPGRITNISGGFDGMLLRLQFVVDETKGHFLLNSSGNIRLRHRDVTTDYYMAFNETLTFIRIGAIWYCMSDLVKTVFSGKQMMTGDGITSMVVPTPVSTALTSSDSVVVTTYAAAASNGSSNGVSIVNLNTTTTSGSLSKFRIYNGISSNFTALNTIYWDALIRTLPSNGYARMGVDTGDSELFLTYNTLTTITDTFPFLYTPAGTLLPVLPSTFYSIQELFKVAPVDLSNERYIRHYVVNGISMTYSRSRPKATFTGMSMSITTPLAAVRSMGVARFRSVLIN